MTDELPFAETARCAPDSAYGQSKLAAEGYLALWRRMRGLDATVVRLGNVYGPRQDPARGRRRRDLLRRSPRAASRRLRRRRADPRLRLRRRRGRRADRRADPRPRALQRRDRCRDERPRPRRPSAAWRAATTSSPSCPPARARWSEPHSAPGCRPRLACVAEQTPSEIELKLTGESTDRRHPPPGAGRTASWSRASPTLGSAGSGL